MDKKIKKEFGSKVKTPVEKAELRKMLALDKKLDKQLGKKDKS
jgi:hypothetical protein